MPTATAAAPAPTTAAGTPSPSGTRDGRRRRPNQTPGAGAPVATPPAEGPSGFGDAPVAKAPRGVVFVRRPAPELDSELFTVPARGGIAKRLPLKVVAPSGPAWSPDGRRLAFAAGRNEEADIYVVRRDGSNLRRLTRNGVAESGPAWSPDGRRLVFVRSAGRRTRRSSLWVMESAGGAGPRRLTRGGIDLQPAFAPDGRRIAFLRIDAKTSHAGVYLADLAGGSPRRIARGLGNVSDPVFSPDGRRLLLFDHRSLLLADVAGRSSRVLVRLRQGPRGAVLDPTPAWDPAGQAVVFSQPRPDVPNKSDLWVVQADGSRLRRLTSSPGLDSDPSWQPGPG